MSKLFEPLSIKDVNLRNRIVMSPMVQYSASEGFADNWHLVHYGSRATGGVALIIQEATAVSPEGRITPGDLGIYYDKHIDKLREIITFIHQTGAIAGIQLAHGGRKASCSKAWEGGKQLSPEQGGWTPLAPSAIPFQPGDSEPLAMSMTDIRKVISDFSRAASRALEAGYRVLEIHAAHGYLIHEFLSPLSNRRTDQYGGPFVNRIRLLREIVIGVKEVWPSNLPLFVRISATDWVEGGWNVEEAVQLAVILKEQGVDLIDCSSGGMVPDAVIPFGPGYQVEFAERIRRQAGIMTGTVGLITSALQAEDILQNGRADLVFFARELLRNPYFALSASKNAGIDIDWPKQYLRAKG